MKLNTGRNCIKVLWKFDRSPFLMPVRASEDYVGKIFRFDFAANTNLAYMKCTVRTHFMPDASKRGIESTTKAVLRTVGTTLQVSKALCAQTGFQAPKVRPRSSYFRKQRAS
eukprot:618530-Amphidinium_carterae.2